MRFFKAVFFVACLFILALFASVAQAEGDISIQHRVISSEPQETGSSVVMELTLANNGTSTLSAVKITPGAGTEHILAASTQPMNVSAISAGAKLTASWSCNAVMSADYEQFVAFTRGRLFLKVEAANESGQTTVLTVLSQSINN